MLGIRMTAHLAHKSKSKLLVNFIICAFNYKCKYNLSLSVSKISVSRPQWSQGNVLASRSKVRGFKPN